MTRIGIVLSGCGYQDGSEIHEATLALLTLQEAGATVECFAPAKPQTRVANHLTGASASGTRQVLEESARIARGKIRDLREASPAALDALVLPGGFGAALNLSDFALKGTAATVDADLERLLLAMHEAGKPIGAICIAPAVLAKVFGRLAPRLTIGRDRGTAEALTALGAVHVEAAVTDCVVDPKNRLVTTPAYMYDDARIADVYQGIRKLAEEVVKLTKERH
jgi:enhancing lycopene biosynthesis protein 2